MYQECCALLQVSIISSGNTLKTHIYTVYHTRYRYTYMLQVKLSHGHCTALGFTPLLMPC